MYRCSSQTWPEELYVNKRLTSIPKSISANKMQPNERTLPLLQSANNFQLNFCRRKQAFVFTLLFDCARSRRRQSPDADIAESLGGNLLRTEHIPAVHEEWLPDRGKQALPFDSTEFIPFRYDQDRRCTFCGLVGVGTVGDFGKDRSGFFGGLGIIGADDRTFLDQGIQECD